MEQYLKDKLDNIINETSTDEVLGEIGYDNIRCWLHNYACGRYDYIVTDNEEAKSALKEVGKYISPKRYLGKEDLKKEICDFIDFWFV